MHIIYNDPKADRSGKYSFHLILLAGGWHVVANGYLCRVKDQEEGRQLLMTFQSSRERHDPCVDKP